MVGKGRFGFDTTSAATIAASDNVGAFVRAATGELITTTLLGAKQGLDVNLINPITINADGFYDATNNPIVDTVGQVLSIRTAAADNTTSTFRTSGGVASADAVVAANVRGADVNSFNMAYNGTTWDRVRNFGLGNLAVADVCSAITVTKGSVAGATPALMVSTPAANRRKITFQNRSNLPLYIGTSATITIDDYVVGPYAEIELPWTAAVVLYVLGVAGQKFVVIEHS